MIDSTGLRVGSYRVEGYESYKTGLLCEQGKHKIRNTNTNVNTKGSTSVVATNLWEMTLTPLRTVHKDMPIKREAGVVQKDGSLDRLAAATRQKDPKRQILSLHHGEPQGICHCNTDTRPPRGM